MRILCLKVGRSDTQGKESAILWITTPEPLLSVTPALESPPCKTSIYSLPVCCITSRVSRSHTRLLHLLISSPKTFREKNKLWSLLLNRDVFDLLNSFFFFPLSTKGPQIAYERSFRWKLAHFRYLCQVGSFAPAKDCPDVTHFFPATCVDALLCLVSV